MSLGRCFVSVRLIGEDASAYVRLGSGVSTGRTVSAHDKTLANGEITVLDSSGYGAVDITKSVNIINDGIATFWARR